jgi:hypothetical protein
MKKFLCLAALLLTLPGCAIVSEFNKGFQEGYNKGLESQKKSGTEVSSNPAESPKTTESGKPSEPKNTFQQAVLKRTADQLNKNVPTKIDEETVLTKVDVEKDGLLYNYELVSFSSEQISNESATQTFRPLVKDRLCADSATKTDLKNGYSYYYAYYGKDKKLITKFAITPKDCGF